MRPGESSGFGFRPSKRCSRLCAQAEVRARVTPTAHGPASIDSSLERTLLFPRPNPPGRPERRHPDTSGGRRAWRAGRPAHPRARAQFRGGWSQPKLTLAMETRRRPRHYGGDLITGPPELLCLRVPTTGILPAAAPNPGLPAKVQSSGCLGIVSFLG